METDDPALLDQWLSPSEILDVLKRLDDIEKTLSIQLQRMAAMQAQIDHNAARLRS